MLTREHQMSLWVQREQAKTRLAYYEHVRRYIQANHVCDLGSQIITATDCIITRYRALIQTLSDRITDDTLADLGST